MPTSRRPGFVLVNNPKDPQIARHYEPTFSELKSLPCYYTSSASGPQPDVH